MRCLTLADNLREKGAGVAFIQRTVSGNRINFLEKKGYSVYPLDFSGDEVLTSGKPPAHGEPSRENWEADAGQTEEVLKRHLKNPDWLIVDHYGLDRQWESRMRPLARRIMVIDDLADRPHDCDLLLDQNLNKDNETRYSGLIPEGCRLLMGPRFVLLRPEFAETRRNPRTRDGTVRRWFIFFGAVDPDNLTARVLQAYQALADDTLAADVIVGDSNPHRESIKRQCDSLNNVTFHCQTNNMAELMSGADLAIGAGGTTNWERCSSGLPALIVSIARNQDSNAEQMHALGAALYLGKTSEVTPDRILEGMRKCIQDEELVSSMSQAGLKLVDGKGADRVLAEMRSK